MKAYCRFFSFVCALALSSSAFAKQTLHYLSETGGVSTDQTWTVFKKDGSYLVTSVDNMTSMSMQSNGSYQLQMFNSKTSKKDKELDFKLNGKNLVAKSIIKGEKVEKNYGLSSMPWVQEFQFGFQNFLKTKDSSYKFYIIDPKNLDLHEMIAKKQGSEPLTIGDTTYDAVVVKITLTGFKSVFWKAMLWYDKDTQLLLKYKANEGPHTPTTTVCLISVAGDVNTP